MADRKVIAVVGATGAQGGGVARAILADPDGGFAVRAITRDPDSAAARALAAQGAEVVAADVDDEASLTRAFTGAYGAYCVTFFWAHFSVDREQAEARHMAGAAAAAGLRHVVWSTLEDTRRFVPLDDDRMPTLQGKYKVPHFDGKGEADQYFAQLPTTFLLASFYWDNFIHFGSGPKPGPDGALLLTLPIGQAPMAGIAAEDIGRCAYGIFKAGPSMAGQRIGVAGDQLTGDDMAAAMSRAMGTPVRYNEVSPEVYRGFGFPGADDLGNMFQFYRDFAAECNATRDVARSRALNPALQSFDAWLAANAARIPRS
ncbi:MAG: NmrA/HSCARG family protein [Vicinamibacterales bacterium]